LIVPEIQVSQESNLCAMMNHFAIDVENDSLEWELGIERPWRAFASRSEEVVGST